MQLDPRVRVVPEEGGVMLFLPGEAGAPGQIVAIGLYNWREYADLP